MAQAGSGQVLAIGKKDTGKMPWSKGLRGPGRDAVRELMDESGNAQLGGWWREVEVALSSVKRQAGAEGVRNVQTVLQEPERAQTSKRRGIN